MQNKIILCDVDGCLVDWEYAFDIYLQSHGFKQVEGGHLKYTIGKRYGINNEQGSKLVKIFNESAAIGFLPPLRDAMYYVKRLHEEHGYTFHAITSLGTDDYAQELRKMNLRKLFGQTVFSEFIFLDTNAPKDEVLEQYRDTGYYWIEDKITNAVAGHKVGLKSLLVEHGHNMEFDHPEIQRVTSWKEIYNIITDSDI